MKKKAEAKTKDPYEDFVGYEDARIKEKDENPEEVSEKSVKAATNRLLPDEGTMDRG